MKKILVTGSQGFVGKNLTPVLESLGYDLIKVGNSKLTNLTDWKSVEQLPKSDTIVHLAAKSFIPDSFNNPLNFYQNNINSTLNILEKARIDSSNIIFLSTYVYGIPQYLPIDENHQRQPLNPYTQSKIICEDLCEAYNRDFGVPVTIFRPFNIYGIGQSNNFFIPTILNQLKQNKIQLQDPRPKRDFIYIGDVIEALVMAISNIKSQFVIYNLGTSVSTSISEVVELIQQILNKNIKIHYSNQMRQGEVLETISNIDKIKADLGWKPKFSLKDGLIKTVLKY